MNRTANTDKYFSFEIKQTIEPGLEFTTEFKKLIKQKNTPWNSSTEMETGRVEILRLAGQVG